MNLEVSPSSAYTDQVIPGDAPLFIYMSYLLCHVVVMGVRALVLRSWHATFDSL